MFLLHTPSTTKLFSSKWLCRRPPLCIVRHYCSPRPCYLQVLPPLIPCHLLNPLTILDLVTKVFEFLQLLGLSWLLLTPLHCAQHICREDGGPKKTTLKLELSRVTKLWQKEKFRDVGVRASKWHEHPLDFIHEALGGQNLLSPSSKTLVLPLF